MVSFDERVEPGVIHYNNLSMSNNRNSIKVWLISQFIMNVWIYKTLPTKMSNFKRHQAYYFTSYLNCFAIQFLSKYLKVVRGENE